MSKLVIVESPTKVKKIQQFLPPGFVVDSCVGHIRDLPGKKSEIPAKYKSEPWADYGVNVDDEFQPIYITIRGKGKVITELKRKLKSADELYLATDEDREGESISWHLVEALKPKVPVKRMVFNEITKKAVLEALENARDVDMNMVQAQETRRILDRLYGYALSPLLWKKVGGNLSAGRVQSVAVRLVVMRERERRAFQTGSYWDLAATLHQGGDFDAKLQSVGGTRVATGKDFDKDTGHVKAGLDVVLLDEEAATSLQTRLRQSPWTVSDITHTSKTSKPYPPYTTSTLQIDANNRLGYGARRTMDIAQRLYQNGFITYMRTDSTALSDEAIKGSKAAVLADFGSEFYAGPRKYEKKAKNAQEAHEAIRPAGDEFQHPDRCELSGDEQKLYRLIWQRTLASQMADERYTSTRATIDAADATFVANGKRVDFAGYRAVYAIKDKDGELPALEAGDSPELKDLAAEGHETKPPARFTEASLVKSLEQEAIGRPSTYASILDTIQRRGYVILKGKALVPSFTAFAVTGLLEKNFPTLVDTGFTAAMEETLDDIAAGKAEWVPFLRTFFHGKQGIQALVAERLENMDPAEARKIDLGDTPFTVKIGRFGTYVETEQDGERVSASIPEHVTPDELDDALLQRLLEQKAAGPKVLGKDPVSGQDVLVLEGRFGPYYQLGEQEEGSKVKPKRASIPSKNMDDADLSQALFLLHLPRMLGEHPNGGEISANIGRFGPYVALQKPGADKPEYRSLKDLEHLQSIEAPEAIELLNKPKGGRRGPTVLAELGPHPNDGNTVQVLNGRYGAYVKHAKTNATVPKDLDATKLTMEQALAILQAKLDKSA